MMPTRKRPRKESAPTIKPARRSNDVDRYLKHTPKLQRDLMSALRTIILETIPDVEETIKYTVPFYSRMGLLCYLNPLKKKDGIYLGFAEGHHLSDESGILTGKHLKQIRYMEFRTPSDINVRIIRSYLQEAVILNELKRNPFPV